MACHRILVLPWSCTREILTACISFRWNPMSSVAHATDGCEFIGPATAVLHGSLWYAAYPKRVLTKQSCAMGWPPIHTIRSEFTLGHGAANSLARGMKEGLGRRYSKGCHPWSAYGLRLSRTPLLILGHDFRSPRLH